MQPTEKMDRIAHYNRIIGGSEPYQPSHLIWRKARAMEAIDFYMLRILPDLKTPTCVVFIQIANKERTQERAALTDLQMAKLMNNVTNQYFPNAFEAVEAFLRKLEELKCATADA